ALIVPPGYAPDEPAHFEYARQIAETATLPILRPGTSGYEAHQPPLYYLLAAAVYRALAPAGEAAARHGLRALSIALGAGTIVLGWATARAIWPRDRVMPLAVAAFPLAVPMHVAMSAAINNDALAEAVLSALLLVLVRGVVAGFGPGLTALAGALLGAALL